MEKLLLGIIIDVSSSMKKNWGGDLKIKQSKIEAVKDALNDEIQRLSILNRNEKTDRRLFCLGMGFILPLDLVSVGLSDGGEKKSKNINTELVGIICDLLALSDLIPSQQKLQTIKESIRFFWDKKASELLSNVKANENYHVELEKFIREGLIESFRVDIHNYFANGSNIFQNITRKFLYLMKIPISEILLEERASILSKNYSKAVKEKADKIFATYKEKYEQVIENKIEDFASQEIQKILERNTLGFSVDTILENFDKNSLERLSEDIITEIQKDIKAEFKEVWGNYKLEFWTKKFKFISFLNMTGVKLETENTIKNIGWFNLKPFIEEFVFKIFHKKFEDVSKQMLKEWINMSTHREVIKPINDLTNIFPNTSEKNIYSEEYMLCLIL